MSRAITTPRAEERAARAQYRQLERARKASVEAAEKEAKGKLADIIRDERTRPRARTCRCGLRPGMTVADLSALGEGCTHRSQGYICPTLDAVRRRMGR
jgi:predicted methyltransferase